MTTPEDGRTRAALNLVAGLPDEHGEVLRRRGTRRTALIIAATLGPLMILGAIAGVLLARNADRPGRAIGTTMSPWRATLGTTLSLVALVLMVVSVVLAVRGGLWRGWRSPLFALPAADRRRLARQVLGKCDVDPARLPLAQAVAKSLITQQYSALIQLAVLLNFVGFVVRADSPALRVLFGALSVLLVVSSVVVVRQARRAKRFLAIHPVDVAAGTAGKAGELPSLP